MNDTTVDVWHDWLVDPTMTTTEYKDYLNHFDDCIMDMAEPDQDAITFWDDDRMTLLDAYIELVHEIEALQTELIAKQDTIERLAEEVALAPVPHYALALGFDEGWYE